MNVPHQRNPHVAARFYLIAAAICALAHVAMAHADANPGYDRPGIGFTPAVLQAGDVTWEQGLPDWSEADGASQYTADSLFRLGVGGPFELQLGSSWNRLDAAAQTATGRGSSSVGMKFALPASDSFSWGLLSNVTFSDGAREFRNMQRQYLLGAAFNWQLDKRDAFGAYLQNVRSDGRDDQMIALNVGRTLTATFGAYVEIAWQRSATEGNGSMAGTGLTWLVTPRVQLDASFDHRLGGATNTWQAGLGASVFFGEL